MILSSKLKPDLLISILFDPTVFKIYHLHFKWKYQTLTQQYCRSDIIIIVITLPPFTLLSFEEIIFIFLTSILLPGNKKNFSEQILKLRNIFFFIFCCKEKSY